MKVTTTSARLKALMTERNLRQVDILNAAKPYCIQYDVKLEKNDLSQYVNGKVEPGQEKLSILGLALNVSEAWLMGYDVSPSRDFPDPDSSAQSENSNSLLLGQFALSNFEIAIIHKFRCLDERGQASVLSILEHEYNSLPGENAVSHSKEA